MAFRRGVSIFVAFRRGVSIFGAFRRGVCWVELVWKFGYTDFNIYFIYFKLLLDHQFTFPRHRRLFTTDFSYRRHRINPLPTSHQIHYRLFTPRHRHRNRSATQTPRCDTAAWHRGATPTPTRRVVLNDDGLAVGSIDYATDGGSMA